jgi:hypothetical protein
MSLTFSIIVALAFSTFIYIFIVVVNLIRLSILKVFFPSFFNTFINKSNQTQRRTQNGWYREYIKYSISNYTRLFFRDNCIARTIFNYLNTHANSNRYCKSDKNIINLPKIPFKKNSLNSNHADKSSTGETNESTTSKQNLSGFLYDN